MSVYRKVEVQTWGDKKFIALSPLPPCGQGLWLYLLTGPRTGILPGLLHAGRAAMAEELGWSVEAFDEAFGEAFRLGMVEADWKARLVWLPNALRESNKPENPNVAIAWRKAFDVLPECELKTAAGDAIRTFLADLGAKYLAAFAGDPAAPGADGEGADRASPKGTGKPLGNPSGKCSRKGSAIQEQEQEQKQTTTDTHTAGAGESPPGRVVPFAAGPDGTPRHCAYHSPHGLDVPHGLHRVFVRRLTTAGASVDDANETLFVWYRETEAAWAGLAVVAATDYEFWRARWRERYGTTGRPVSRPRGAAPAVEPWLCRHEPRCGHRTGCALTTTKEVRAGTLRLEDVPAVLRSEVLDFLEGPDGPTAVQA
jgi:hypothetical protein